jgi:hypothetical protein
LATVFAATAALVPDLDLALEAAVVFLFKGAFAGGWPWPAPALGNWPQPVPY